MPKIIRKWVGGYRKELATELTPMKDSELKEQGHYSRDFYGHSHGSLVVNHSPESQSQITVTYHKSPITM